MSSRAITALVAATAVAVGATGALADKPTAKAAGVATASATAYARDNGDGSTPRGYVTSSGNGGQGGGAASVSTSTTHGNAQASASARVDGISIFNGLVTADTAEAAASAPGDGRETTSGRVVRLVIGGKRQRTPRSRTTYEMAGYGTVVALDDSGRGIVALTAKLSKPYRSHPKGATVKVAFATASAQDGADPNPPKKPPKPKPSKPHKHATPTTPAKPPKAHTPTKPHKARRRKPSRTHVLLTGKGFVFPVYGKHNFTDTFGAFRADTGFHEGNDIFADAGTPLVAVCDGSLNRVGTLPISGNRLWVKCSKTGDGFFYAHLSAFATDTRSGEKVTAGQVIGFVGSTGDAEQTPPHCHFEVHPGNGPAVDPYPFLRAWESHRDVPAAAWVRANGELGQQQPGTLVVVKDFLNP
ncbi:MAG: peptidoglycan LD-endopeptidase LytH [Thermoleophilaceae bacterium]|nr:peptidoglycan LD-endopeptidase LytH [Thermoleophilaceae bacterium]MEA2471866.1 peptidoglycan LD-endopeptidase LytH [Thermoleophilaceae bacterium]